MATLELSDNDLLFLIDAVEYAQEDLSYEIDANSYPGFYTDEDVKEREIKIAAWGNLLVLLNAARGATNRWEG